MNKSIILVLVAEFFITIGQICFKKAAFKSASSLNAPLRLVPVWLKMSEIWLGLLVMVIGLLFWFAALASGELSFVYLLGSIQYIFMLMAAHFFLNEKINREKFIGTLLITIGIILTFNSQHCVK